MQMNLSKTIFVKQYDLEYLDIYNVDEPYFWQISIYTYSK